MAHCVPVMLTATVILFVSSPLEHALNAPWTVTAQPAALANSTHALRMETPAAQPAPHKPTVIPSAISVTYQAANAYLAQTILNAAMDGFATRVSALLTTAEAVVASLHQNVTAWLVSVVLVLPVLTTLNVGTAFQPT